MGDSGCNYNASYFLYALAWIVVIIFFIFWLYLLGKKDDDHRDERKARRDFRCLVGLGFLAGLLLLAAITQQGYDASY